MQRAMPTFKSPPVATKADGSVRLVGFEFEFSGLSLEQAAEAVQTALDGSLRSKSAATREIEAPGMGSFTVEIDWDFLKRMATEAEDEAEPSGWIDTLGQAVAILVPVEVVCPALPIDELDRLMPAVEALRTAGAVGTEESLFAAYGVHINSEIPSLDAGTLHAYLRAFALLQWWLVEAHEVDPTRRLSFFIEPYPEAYVKHLLDQRDPPMDRILADYLEHNASRNRALDLLPLLAEVDAGRVRRAVDDPKIKARPAFHYRMPNCHIERPDWSPAHAWNLWWIVEKLAASPRDLDSLGGEFLATQRPVLGARRSGWVTFMDRWLIDRGWA